MEDIAVRLKRLNDTGYTDITVWRLNIDGSGSLWYNVEKWRGVYRASQQGKKVE